MILFNEIQLISNMNWYCQSHFNWKQKQQQQDYFLKLIINFEPSIEYIQIKYL